MHKIYYFFRGDTKKEALRIVNAAKIRVISYASGKEAPGLVSCFICPAISFGVFWKKGENNDTNSNKYVTEYRGISNFFARKPSPYVDIHF